MVIPHTVGAWRTMWGEHQRSLYEGPWWMVPDDKLLMISYILCFSVHYKNISSKIFHNSTVIVLWYTICTEDSAKQTSGTVNFSRLFVSLLHWSTEWSRVNVISNILCALERCMVAGVWGLIHSGCGVGFMRPCSLSSSSSFAAYNPPSRAFHSLHTSPHHDTMESPGLHPFHGLAALSASWAALLSSSRVWMLMVSVKQFREHLLGGSWWWLQLITVSGVIRQISQHFVFKRCVILHKETVSYGK